MKLLTVLLLALLCPAGSALADLTMVQNVEGAGPVGTMTIKIKGTKARIDATPQVSTIIDAATGDMLNLMHDQKKFMRVSGEQAKAVAEMALKSDGATRPAAKPQLKPTGKKETINGYEAEEYLCDAAAFKATYWIATAYPNAAEIVKQLQTMTPEAWGAASQAMPDYRQFPGLPLRSTINFNGEGQNIAGSPTTTITTTLVSVNQEPLNDAEFMPPKGFEELKMPSLDGIFGNKRKSDAGGAKPTASPKR